MKWSTLWRHGESGYRTCSADDYTLSAIYLTASAARRLLGEGVPVRLPEDYTLEVLDSIAWMTGSYGSVVNVSDRQAHEVAQIAHNLMNHHVREVNQDELAGLQEVIKVVSGVEGR